MTFIIAARLHAWNGASVFTVHSATAQKEGFILIVVLFAYPPLLRNSSP
ncbi:hypothetical protein ACLBKS_01585 [Hylemonella sp. W303a]